MKDLNFLDYYVLNTSNFYTTLFTIIKNTLLINCGKDLTMKSISNVMEYVQVILYNKQFLCKKE